MSGGFFGRCAPSATRRTRQPALAVALAALSLGTMAGGCGRGAPADGGPDVALDTLAGYRLGMTAAEARDAARAAGEALECSVLAPGAAECGPRRSGTGAPAFTLYFSRGRLRAIGRPAGGGAFAALADSLARYGPPRRERYDTASPFGRYRATWQTVDSAATLSLFCPDTLHAGGCELFLAGTLPDEPDAAAAAAEDLALPDEPAADEPLEPEDAAALDPFLRRFLQHPSRYLGVRARFQGGESAGQVAPDAFRIRFAAGRPLLVVLQPALAGRVAAVPAGQRLTVWGTVRPVSALPARLREEAGAGGVFVEAHGLRLDP